MGMEVNGSAVLAAIASAPASFGMTPSQINALAVGTLLGRLKDKSSDLVRVRSMAKAIGRDDFALTIDQMPAKDVAALTKRLDPKHPNLRDGGDSWLREQLVKLADGAVEPSLALPKSRRTTTGTPPRTKVPKTGEVMKSKALRPRASRKPATND